MKISKVIRGGLSVMIMVLLFIAFVSPVTETQAQRGRTDLVVTNIAITPESPKPGDEITIRVTVANQGESDVDSSFYTQLVISLGPPEMAALGFGGMQIGVTRIRGGLDEGEEVPGKRAHNLAERE